MRTIFTSHDHDSCTIKYLNKDFDIIENRTFIRRKNYVFELLGFNGAERQLCRNLSRSGITLMCDPTVDLIDVIRKEYRKFIDQQQKIFN
jgi:hypothetical protein